MASSRPVAANDEDGDGVFHGSMGMVLLTGRAGTPAHTSPAGTDFVTTEPAPMTAPSPPMRTPLEHDASGAEPHCVRA